MADRTPLLQKKKYESWSSNQRTGNIKPEEFVAVFHELGFYQIYRAYSDIHPGEILHERWEEWMVSVQFNLTWTGIFINFPAQRV